MRASIQKAEARLSAAVMRLPMGDYESPRAIATRLLQKNWSEWRDDDDRWWAVYEILDRHNHPDDHDALRRGIAACVGIADALGGTRLGVMLDDDALSKLDLHIAELARVAARLRFAANLDNGDSADEAEHDARYAAVLNG